MNSKLTSLVLGIDAGGTHTDAVLCGPEGILAIAKVRTCHDDLLSSLRAVLQQLSHALQDQGQVPCSVFERITRVTLGTTLLLNALVQKKTDSVGLVLTAGPGLAAQRFALGKHLCLLEGGLDHRGVEVAPLETEPLPAAVAAWQKQGVQAIACVGKFSPRNPVHEQKIHQALQELTSLPLTLGHLLSGKLNFPRRIATAYYNAAVARLHTSFLNAAEAVLAEFAIHAPLRFLKADGGALSAASSRREPVQSILSGPAASVMGLLALCPQLADEPAALLLDIGGTTTDIALFAHGSPVLDRDGMRIEDRKTLVRALATHSIGVGGDSRIVIQQGEAVLLERRDGAAIAFGGQEPTLLDALNVYAQENSTVCAGDVAASRNAIARLAQEIDLSSAEFARRIVTQALNRITHAVAELTERINARPVYTLAALKAIRSAQPTRVWLVGGPAEMLADHLARQLHIPVELPPHAHVANAVGAALTRPTATLEVFVSMQANRESLLWAPALDHKEHLPRNTSVAAIEKRTLELLRNAIQQDSPDEEIQLEVIASDVFVTLDDYGQGTRDIRVTCQAVPSVI